MKQKAARLSIGGFDQRIELKPEDTFAAFKVDLPAGPTMLLSELERPNGDASGAYYVMVELVERAAARLVAGSWLLVPGFVGRSCAAQTWCAGTPSCHQVWVGESMLYPTG